MYTISDISKDCKIQLWAVRNRVSNLGLTPVAKNNKGGWLFNESQRQEIINYKDRKPQEPEIIYIHTIWHILPSKMNFM